MKEIIFAQVLTINGITEFSGLYDENGDPVSIEMECDDEGISLKIWHNVPDGECHDCGISNEEIMNCCNQHEDCGDCPLNDYCEEEFADE